MEIVTDSEAKSEMEQYQMTNEPKQSKHEHTADGVHFVQGYGTKLQYRTYRTVCKIADVPKDIKRSYGLTKDFAITALVRFDDDCGNGHCTFTITGNVPPVGPGGCIHDLIAIAFPELASSIKWHLTSTDGPMHYVANTVYLAGDKDHNGKRAGDVERYAYGVRFGTSPVTHQIKRSFWEFLKDRYESHGDFQVVAHAYAPRDNSKYEFAPKYSFAGYADKWHECPFESEIEASEYAMALNTHGLTVEFVRIPMAFSKGKVRELASARSAAVWPDATDEQLSVDTEELKGVLTARLPAMMAEFRSAVESLGFDYDFPAKVRTGSTEVK